MVQNPEAHISENMKNISDVYEVQILLAYFLGQINQLCTPNQLTEIATGEGVVNYFVYTEAVSRMLENGTLDRGSFRLLEESLRLTGENRFRLAKLMLAVPTSRIVSIIFWASSPSGIP